MEPEKKKAEKSETEKPSSIDEMEERLKEAKVAARKATEDEKLRQKDSQAAKRAAAKAANEALRETKRQDRVGKKLLEMELIRETVAEALDAKYKIRHDAGALRRFSWDLTTQTVQPLAGTDSIERDIQTALKAAFGIQNGPDLRDHLKVWETTTDLLTEEPVAFAFASDPRIAFCRIKEEPVEGEWSAWKEFTDRLDARRVFQAWVWSCLEEKNESRQYIWLQGDGEDGKSVVLKELSRLFGQAARGVNGAQIRNDSNFMGSAIYGAHFITFADCKNQNLPMSEFVRNVTSGDPVPIEFKGQTPFTAQLRCKLIIASNVEPKISSQVADTSRLIHIHVDKSKNTDDPGWKDCLRVQMPAFLYACREEYRALVGENHGKIPITGELQESIVAAAAESEASLKELFDEWFIVDKDGHTRSTTMTACISYNFPHDKQAQANFKDYVKRTYSVKYKKLHGIWHFIGIKAKDLQVISDEFHRSWLEENRMKPQGSEAPAAEVPKVTPRCQGSVVANTAIVPPSADHVGKAPGKGGELESPLRRGKIFRGKEYERERKRKRKTQ